jgi:hypothetical protein
MRYQHRLPLRDPRGAPGRQDTWVYTGIIGGGRLGTYRTYNNENTISVDTWTEKLDLMDLMK